MNKLNKISAQFDNIINCMDAADSEIQKLPRDLADASTVYEFHNKIQNLIEEIEDFQMEICIPLEMEAEERENEIRSLEARLHELKSMR